MNWMGQRALRFTTTLAWVVASALLMVACQKADVPHSATLDRAALMHLPFPSWQTADQGKIQQLDLSAQAPAKGKSKADATPTLVEVTPLYVVRLDETHAACDRRLHHVD